jgi:transcriptional regulator with XRE-family HTH domain
MQRVIRFGGGFVIAVHESKSPYTTQGYIIRSFREARGWTQEKLALLINTDRSCVSRWEQKGCRDWLMMMRVCEALGFTLEIRLNDFIITLR